MLFLRGHYCLLFFTFLLFCSCTKKTQSPILLKVGIKTWDLKSFEKALNLKLKNISSVEQKSKKDFQKIKQNLVQDLIVKSLIEIWVKKNKIKPVTLKEPVKKIQAFYTKPILSEVLQIQRKQKSLRESLLNHLSKEIPKPSLSKQKNYYKKNKKLFYKARSCFLEQILVSSKSLAKKLLLQIKEGKSFNKLKFLHSLKPDIGWIEMGTLDAFDQACQLSINSLSPVLKSPYGYHIFKVIKKRRAIQKTFFQVQKEIIKILLEKPKKEAFQRWLKAEILKTPIFIDKNLLDKIHIQYKSESL